MVNNIAINLKNLLIGYNKEICSPLNLKAYNGDFICIIGKNGTGKSTLLKTIAGIINQLSGEIFYNEICSKDINSGQKSKIISFVPSRLTFFSNIKVFDLIAIGRSPYTNIFNKFDYNDYDIIYKSIDMFGLKEIINKPLFEISDGERQKAMICRAFVQNTPIILLDEPTAFLDYPSKVELLESLKNLSLEKDKTIIFSSHDLELSLKRVNKTWIFMNNEVVSKTIADMKYNKVLEDIFGFRF